MTQTRIHTRQSIGLLIGAMALMVLVPAAHGQVVFRQYTPYNHVVVEDQGDTRIMWFDRAPQTTMSKSNPLEGGFEYTDFFHIAPILYPAMDSVLFVGLGGGTGPKQFLHDYPWMQVEVVEIDPVVVDLAHEYFYLPRDPRLAIHVADGRVHLRRTNRRYGSVIIDAYSTGPSGAYIPFHLATHEFFQIVRDRLDNGGTVIYNVIGVAGGPNDHVVRATQSTLASVFEAVYVFQARSSMNTVLVAQKIEQPAATAEESPGLPQWPEGPWVHHPLDASGFRQLFIGLQQQGRIRRGILGQRVTQFSPINLGPLTHQVLTDNYAPVDSSWGAIHPLQ